MRRFYGNVTLNPMRLGRNAGDIGEEILQHLSALVGADVNVTLEIHVSVPDGVPDGVVRTVSENARTGSRMATHPARAVGWTKSGGSTIPMSANPLHRAQNLAAAEMMARLG